MGMEFWGWGKESKTARMNRLEGETIRLEGVITRLEDKAIDTSIENGKINAAHKLELNNLITKHEDITRDLTKEVRVLRENYDIDVENARTEVFNKAEKSENDKEHKFNKRMMELEKQAALNETRRDKALEQDKISYRNYLRTETNKRMDSLESDNKRLLVENAKLIGENKALEGSRTFFMGAQEIMSETVKGLTKALPTITASFTTPEVVVQLPSTGTKPENKGGEQKKN